jgi:beta-mannosidase
VLIPPHCSQAASWVDAVVPGTVHIDLMANGIIPDQFFRMNEKDVQ